MATSFFYIYIAIYIDICITFTNWRRVQSFYWTPFFLYQIYVALGFMGIFWEGGTGRGGLPNSHRHSPLYSPTGNGKQNWYFFYRNTNMGRIPIRSRCFFMASPIIKHWRTQVKNRHCCLGCLAWLSRPRGIDFDILRMPIDKTEVFQIWSCTLL